MTQQAVYRVRDRLYYCVQGYIVRWHCQSNLTPAQQSCIWVRSDRQLSPFSKRRIAALPEVGPTGEMTIEVEMVVDGGVDGDKLL